MSVRALGDPRRHPWRYAAAGLALAVLLVLLVGGFRAADPPYPPAQLGETVDLGRFRVSVRSADLVDADAQGKPFEDGTHLVLQVRVRNTSTATGYLAQGLVRAVANDSPRELKPTLGGDRLQFQPDLTQTVRLHYLIPSGRKPTRVRVVLFSESYAWSNLLADGADWSGQTPSRELSLPLAAPR